MIGTGLIFGYLNEGFSLDVLVLYAEAVVAAAEMKRAVSANTGIVMLDASRPIG